jgi:hypothetical protein
MNVHSQVQDLLPSHPAMEGRSRSLWAVTSSVQLVATPLRILYALTIPEYFEAWFMAPGIDSVRCERDRASINCLQLSLCRAGSEVRHIKADYTQPRLHSLHLSWRATPCSSAESTRVRVLLRPRMRETLLHLQHSGFVSIQEWSWHQQMWKDSLQKMQTVLR